MKSDEGFSDMLDKTILIDYLNENVIPKLLKQKFKKGSFYCPFFFLISIFSKFFKFKSFRPTSVFKSVLSLLKVELFYSIIS